MRVETVKRPEKRFNSPNISTLGIQAYGKNNLYPVMLTEIVDASDTASVCLARYIKFIVGDGFVNKDFENRVCNDDGETFGDVLGLVCEDLARYGGASLLVNYNLLGYITEVYHVPFINGRLAEYDDDGRVLKICLFADWTGTCKYGGKVMKPKPDNVIWVDRFNPDPTFIQESMAEAGGIEFWRGQILWYSNAGKSVYPRSKYDAGVTAISTDEGLTNIAYRTVRSGFYTAGAFVMKKGQSTVKDDEDTEDWGPAEGSIEYKLMQLQGDTNLNKIMYIELDYEEEMPEFLDFGGKNYDKDFQVTNDNTVERIYAIFEQEGFHRIRKGSIGFSSDMIAQVYEYYNSVTSSERRTVERLFNKITDHWHEELPENVTEIQPLKYVVNEETTATTNIYNKDTE